NTSVENTTVVSQADLSIAKTAISSSAGASQTITYTISVGNSGPSAATTITVTDVLPAGVTYLSASGTSWTCSYDTPSRTVTCTLPSLVVSNSAQIQLRVSAPGQGGTVSNTATVAAATPDPNQS